MHHCLVLQPRMYATMQHQLQLFGASRFSFTPDSRND